MTIISIFKKVQTYIKSPYTYEENVSAPKKFYVLKSYFFLVTLTAGTALFLYAAFLPTTHFTIGNIFFGNYPSLYNVDLAQYFFKYSSYPLLGNAPEFSHYQLSRTYFIKGELYDALFEAKTELLLYPNNKRTYYILGLTYGYMNREEEGILSFSKFIDAYPESWAARNDSAWLQFRIGDVDGALETIQSVAWITDNPWVQNTYGTLLLNKGRFEEAKIAFGNANAVVADMTVEKWGTSYPGNDPQIYEVGLAAMKASIQSNYKLIQNE